NLRATMIPGVVVPLSLIGTFGIMYLLGYSLDNLSLMALTICTGFVVDDAIVVIENISRYREQGMPPFEAAIKGAAGIGFTVISISISLVAVFIPILLMSGIVGRRPRFIGHFAHHDADDERAAAQAAWRREPWPLVPCERALFQGDAGPLRKQPVVGSGPSAAYSAGRARDARAEHFSVPGRAQGILPTAGYGAPVGRGAGRP